MPLRRRVGRIIEVSLCYEDRIEEYLGQGIDGGYTIGIIVVILHWLIL